MAGVQNIIIEQGSRYDRDIKLKDGSGNYIVLTGKTFQSQIRKRADSSTILASFVFTVVDSTTVNMVLTSSVTAGLDFDTGVYDVEVTHSVDNTERFLEGSVTLSPNVTR